MIGYGNNSEKTWVAAMLVRHPHIACATMAMAYDNWCVNRDQTEEQIADKLVTWMKFDRLPLAANQRVMALALVERQLSRLSHEQLVLLCCGKKQEGTLVLASIDEARGGPTDQVLIAIREEVLGCE